MNGMRHARWKVVLLGWLFIFLVTVPLLENSFAQQPSLGTDRFALLIGVGEYPGLGAGEQLDGSLNDVAIMREMLVQRFGFPDENVVTLVNEQATGEGIRGGFRNLIEQLDQRPDRTTPAQVVIHFSGHGSQLPDQDSGAGRDETDDGLDETWVPYDATKQGGDQDIRDDEINGLVNAVCGDGRAQLLIVFDGCHSGSGARGATKIRQLQRDVTPTSPSANEAITPNRLPQGAVFLSACRARETEPEFQEGDTTYGLLTRFLVQTLSQEQRVSGLSYDLLQKAIVSNYRLDRRVMNAPSPQLEGSPETLRKSVLGFGPEVDRPPYFAVENTSNAGQVRLKGGRFHGVSVGSVFELYERPEQIGDRQDEAGLSVAWLRVRNVDGVTSQADVVRWADEEQSHAVTDELPSSFQSGFAVLRRQESEASGLRIRIVRVLEAGHDSDPIGPQDAELPKMIEKELAQKIGDGESHWNHRITQQDEACDLILRIDGAHAALFPATGVSELPSPLANDKTGDFPASLRGGWGPFDVDTGKVSADPQLTINGFLRQISKARNLISLAQSGADQTSGDFECSFELMKIILNEEEEVVSQQPWTQVREGDGMLPNPLTVPEGERYAFRVINQGTKPVYVTILSISPNMGIEVVMPYDEPPIKLEAGESRISDRFRCTPPHGTNHAILLVTREPADFGFVASPDLKISRNASLTGGAKSLSDQLAEVAFFQPPVNRGRTTRPGKESDSSWCAKILEWRTTK